jgi:Fic family protein
MKAVIRAYEKLTARDRYLHWDDLRRRPAPEGFTHTEWWYALKLKRSSRMQAIGLEDRSGQKFRFGVPDVLAELLHQIDRGLGFAVNLPDAVTRPETRDQYVISSLIQESITSSQLEGAATTREVAKDLLRTGRPPRDKSERMILNNYLTMQRIRDLRSAELSPAVVFELQSRVTDGTLEKLDASGRLRRADEVIQVSDEEGTVFHDPPPAAQLPDRLAAMCAFANGQAPDGFVHPVIRAIILHFWLAYDHPFVDGNGRTARALFYWSMLRQGYSLFEFISISQILLRAPVRYAEAFLHTETDGNDLTYFILHQAGVIREAVAALHDYVQHKTAQLRATEKKLRGLEGLNHRQQALLSHALRETRTRYVIVSHQRSHNVTHQTARDDLFDLVQRGLLTVRKEGRSYAFYTPADLGEKLAGLAERVGTTPPVSSEETLPLKLQSDSTR